MKCTDCGAEVKHIEASIDPREAALEFRTDCGHVVTADEARAAWRLQIPVGPVPQLNGASLIDAERARQIAEEGHTADKDAALTGGQLPWASWCLLDRAVAKNPVEQAPSVWPLPPEAWPATKSPLRLLIIAGALIAAEIDRLLAKDKTS
jgi:hypothetical protein